MSSALRGHVLVSAFSAALVLAGCGDDGGGGGTPAFSDVGAGLTGVKFCSLAWGDYDNDGDLDLALAGNAGASDVCNVYRNDGGTFTDIVAGLTGAEWCSLAWGDYDNDGDLDLAVSQTIYRNDAGTFIDIGAGLIGGLYSSLAWGDYDNDGDLDFAHAGYTGSYVTWIHRNDAGTFSDIGAGLTGVGYSSMAWGDYDNDGDLDLAVAGSALSMVYRNDGGTFTNINASLVGVGSCSLAWGDFDNDGDLDLALAGGWLDMGTFHEEAKVYRNDGGTFVDVGAGLTGVRYCSLAWGDYDNDGDLDLALAGYAGVEVYVAKIYRNDGGATFTDTGAALTGVCYCSLAWGDCDNDGDLDLAIAGTNPEGLITKVYRNDGGLFNTAPSAPTGLSASYLAAATDYDVTFTWAAPAVADETPDEGLSYDLRVGTSSGADDVFSGMADATTGWRRIPARGVVQPGASVHEWTLNLAAGTYYWSVQAVDTGLAGGAWAAEETVNVVP